MMPSHTFSDHLHLPTLALAYLRLFSSLDFTLTEQILNAKHHVQDCLWVFSLNPPTTLSARHDCHAHFLN